MEHSQGDPQGVKMQGMNYVSLLVDGWGRDSLRLLENQQLIGTGRVPVA
jgi:hypothetical protein